MFHTNSGERFMMHPKCCTLPVFIITTLLAISDAKAQVTIDVSKITCEQLVQYKITNDDSVAIWLSGYYNGKRGNTVVDPQRFKANAKKIRTYCTINSNVTVMQAVETVLGR
jgi:acid stress chaperone HdeB